MAKNNVTGMTEKLKVSSRELIRDIQDQRRRASEQLSALRDLEEAIKARQQAEAERQAVSVKEVASDTRSETTIPENTVETSTPVENESVSRLKEQTPAEAPKEEVKAPAAEKQETPAEKPVEVKKPEVQLNIKPVEVQPEAEPKAEPAAEKIQPVEAKPQTVEQNPVKEDTIPAVEVKETPKADKPQAKPAKQERPAAEKPAQKPNFLNPVQTRTFTPREVPIEQQQQRVLTIREVPVEQQQQRQFTPREAPVNQALRQEGYRQPRQDGGRSYQPREGRDGQPQGQRPYPPRDGQQRPYPPRQNREGQPQGNRPYPPRDGQAARPYPPKDGGFAKDKDEGYSRPVAPRSRNTAPKAEAPLPTKTGRATPYDPNKNNYNRKNQAGDEENRNARNRSRRAEDNLRNGGFDDDDEGGWNKRRGGKKTPKAPKIERKVIETAVITGERVAIKDLAEKIGKPGTEIIKKLMVLGIMATINQDIDYDTAAMVAEEFGVLLDQQIEKTQEEKMVDEYDSDDESKMITRPPIVTVMGHVDHGKTSLLDAIRNTKVTATEAGGITQHIGAYQVQIDGRPITFLDTPGHEAFTSMRARGAQATDIAVLVVAADDGVMPQTVEAINHAKAAGVPILVAINKIDRPAADPMRIKQQLTEYSLVGEEWGGDTIMCEVSAITGQGLDHLLEMILLLADMQELKANPDRSAKGIIIEARLDKNRGPIASVMVQNGTLRVGDNIVVGTTFGRVRAMFDDMGENVQEAGPAVPVEVLGLESTPDAGDLLYAVENDRIARQVAEERLEKQHQESAASSAPVSLDDLFNRVSAGDMKELNIIIKADVRGSAEAVQSSLEKLSNAEVSIKTIHQGVGAVTENDIMLAATSNAVIIAFNIQPNSAIRSAAEQAGVDIRTYRVIYNAIEDMEKALKGMLAPEFKETIYGHAEVRSVFKITGVGAVAGCYVTDGKITRSCSIRVLRDSVVLYEGKLSSLKRFKDDVREVAAGYECGMSVEGYNDIKEQDVLQAFVVEQIERE